MSEGSVHLQRHIEVLIAQRDVRTQRSLRCSLSANASVATIAEVNCSVVVEVFNLILHSALRVLVKSCAVWQIEHAQGLAHNLIEHMIVVASVLTGSVYRAYSSDLGSRHVHTIVVAR